jgi:hypothetical protein
MSERKVLTKYYPPDFDPSALKRQRGPKQAGPKVSTVRLMAPFSMRCTTCGEYVYKGRKFNARKESPESERYLGIQIHRFHIKCTRCSAEIIFRTDPKNQDYAVVKGAKRNTEPWRRGLGEKEEETDEQRLDRLEAEEAELDRMEELEAKMVDAKREMDVADALDEIRTRNARLERADREGVEVTVARPEEEERERQDAEDEAAAKAAFAFARIQAAMEEEPIDEDDKEVEEGLMGPPPKPVKAVAQTTVASSVSPNTTIPSEPAPNFTKRAVKRKKDYSAALGIKKKG